MDDYLGNRVLIINLHQRIPFFGRSIPIRVLTEMRRSISRKSDPESSPASLHPQACLRRVHLPPPCRTDSPDSGLLPHTHTPPAPLPSHKAHRIARQNLWNGAPLPDCSREECRSSFSQCMLLIRHNERRKVSIRPEIRLSSAFRKIIAGAPPGGEG